MQQVSNIPPIVYSKELKQNDSDKDPSLSEVFFENIAPFPQGLAIDHSGFYLKHASSISSIVLSSEALIQEDF